MKGRKLIAAAAAGIGIASMLAGVASPAMAEQRQPEKQFQIHKCSVCGTVVKILHDLVVRQE